ncbi:MAG TPA: enoyl-CoA hydratase-related protein [Candidatus Dormibacteraeota bacterium]|jgi:2-(1,2-epoxy-1,2-dihydrophenyl)acetyl-CoA isomerase|nr:enoyl-CoA hydratase-related protein [Candidatus Dormibacteraeota bacterium]
MSQAAAAPVLLESVHEGIAVLVMNRPERMNALNNDLATALFGSLQRIANDESIRLVVLTGAGRAFCAGGDLGVIGKGREANNAKELEPILRAGMGAVLKIRMMPQPVVAAVNGAAAGAGMNVALAADIRISAEEAVFGQNFAKVGLFPDYGGTFFLPELVGPSKAAEMFYTGDMIDAKVALQLGLVNRVVPAVQLETEVRTLAAKIAAGPPMAIRAVKKVLFASQKEALERALELEVEHQMKCFASEDCLEGVHAFFEKRAPQFHGR